MSNPGTVDGIDHVELFVRNWDDAKAWYEETLGFTTEEAFEQWWKTGEGPLVLSVSDSSAKLAFFEREDATRGERVSPHRVALQTDAEGFLEFLTQLESLEITNGAGKPVTPEDVFDHGLSYSIYFTDLDGNRLELTTNDHEEVSAQLE